MPSENTLPTRQKFYFDGPLTDFGFLHSLAVHGFKGSEIGEVYDAAAKVTEGDPESWVTAWTKLAQKIEQSAREREADEHLVSAREDYLRAVTYYRNATFALRVSDPRLRSTIEKFRELFKKFAALSNPPIEYIEIPYQDNVLPGYFLTPDTTDTKRPTIIIGDNTSEELYYWVGPPAVERGYNVLLIDLPGMGLNAFNGISYRPDVEVPMKDVMDYLVARPDVDASRIAFYGGGPGGYMAARIAAYERRISACIADPFIFDMEAQAPYFAKKVLAQDSDMLGKILSELHALQYGGRAAVMESKVDPSLIQCPVLFLNDSNDDPGLFRQAEVAMKALAHTEVKQHIFKPEDGAHYRQLDNFGLKHRTIFDWLDKVFGIDYTTPKI